MKVCKSVFAGSLFSAVFAILSLTGCTKEKSVKAEKYIEYFVETKSVSLIKAIVDNNETDVLKLAKSGVDLNAVGKYENTPLRVALKMENLGMVKILLDLGADPGFRTPEGLAVAGDAAEHQNPDFLRIMLKYGLNPDIKSGTRPIVFIAIANDRWPQYEMLVAHGADVLKAKTGNNKTVALHMSMQFEYDRLKDLILKGADIETPSATGLTVLEDLISTQRRFSGNPEHPAYKARADILAILRDKGVEIPAGVPGVKYDLSE